MNHLYVTTSLGDRIPKLSSVLTPLFKFGFSTTFIAMTAGTILLLPHAFAGVPDSLLLAIIQVSLACIQMSVACMFLLFLAYSCLRLKHVAADRDHLVIGNYFTETPVDYSDVVEIMAYRGRGLVFLRLRLQSGCSFGNAIHFLLPSTLGKIPSQPEIQLLREKCPQLTEQSRKGWWIYYWNRRAIGK